MVLHDAVKALRAESRYSLTVTDSRGGPGGTPVVYKVDIQKPGRISITGGSNVIAIGSTGYFKAPSGWWSTVRHAGEATSVTNDMCIYIDILRRATAATRNGDTYDIPPAEAARLLVTTGLPRFRGVRDVSLSMTIAGGLLKSVSLHTGGALPISTSTVVTEIGRSPAVEAPPRRQIAS